MRSDRRRGARGERMRGAGTWSGVYGAGRGRGNRAVFEIADRGSRGGRGDPPGRSEPARMSGLDYNILGGVACSNAPLRVTHPPRDPPRVRAARWWVTSQRASDGVLLVL